MASANADSAGNSSIDIGLELRGGITRSPPEADEDVTLHSSSTSSTAKTIRHISVQKLTPSPRCIQLIVDLQGPGPCVVMDAEEANHVAALLLDELERLGAPACLYRVTISQLQFTPEGAAGLSAFLTSYASTIKAVSLNGVLKAPLPNEVDYDYAVNCNSIIQLASAFASSTLDVLNLSGNVLRGASIWRPWRGQQLQQLLLDRVEMDSSSWQALSTTISWESLEDLHVVVDQAMHLPRHESIVLPTDGSVNIRAPSTKTQSAIHHMIRSCTKLASLRWVVYRKQQTSSAAWLPIRGLQEMARRMFQQSVRGGSLRHLVLEGGLADNLEGPLRARGQAEPFLTTQAYDDLCTALSDLPRLRTLKLRHIGLTDLPRIVASLRNSRPPLECLDFSHNLLTDNVRSVCELAKVHKTIKDMNALVLSYNRIDTDTGRELLETFASSPKVSTNAATAAMSSSSSSVCSISSAKSPNPRKMAVRRGSSMSDYSGHDSVSGVGANAAAWSNNPTFDLRLDNNPHLQMNKIAFALATAKHSAETECIALRQQEDKLLTQAMNAEEELLQQTQILNDSASSVRSTRSNHSKNGHQAAAATTTGCVNRGGSVQIEPDGSAAMIAELEQENKRLKEERDTLMKAFSIMGVGNQVKDQKRVLDRLSRLEDMVVLGAVFKNSNKGDNSQTSSDRNRRDQLSTSRSRRKILVSELPYQLERLRGVHSSRSIDSSDAASLLPSTSNHSRSQRRSGIDCQIAEGDTSMSSMYLQSRRRGSVGHYMGSASSTRSPGHSNQSNRSYSNRSHSTASLTDPEPMSPNGPTSSTMIMTPPNLLPASSAHSVSSSRPIGRSRSPGPSVPPPPPPPPPASSSNSKSNTSSPTPHSVGDRWESLVYKQQQKQQQQQQQQLQRTTSTSSRRRRASLSSSMSSPNSSNNHASRGSRTMDGLTEGDREDSP